MRKFLSVFLCALLLLSALCCPVVLAATTADGFEYTVSGSSATITGYSGSATSVTLPSSIEGATVTSVASLALNGSNLTTITVPNSVTSFGSNAFPPEVTLLAGIDSAAMKYALEANITCTASSSSMSGSGGAFVQANYAPLTVYGADGTTLAANTKVHLIGVHDGWATISTGSVTGEVPIYTIARIERYVEPTPTPTPAPKLKLGSAKVVESEWMYKTYSYSADTITALHINDIVTVKAISGEWAGVVFGSYKGYVPSSVLRNTTESASTPVPTVPLKAGKATATKSATMYKSNSTSAAKVTTIPSGATVDVKGIAGSWAAVIYGSYKGYVPSSYLKNVTAATPTPTATPTSVPTSVPTTKPTTEPTTKPTTKPTTEPTSAPTSVPTKTPAVVGGNTTAVTVKSAPIYKSASTSAGKLTTLAAGTKVTVVAVSGNWAGVKTGTYKGYMLVSALTPYTGSSTAKPTSTPKPTSGTVTGNSVAVTTKSTPVYKSASTSAGKLTTLSSGTAVTVVAVSGSWAGIKTGTYKGYVLVSALTPYTGGATAAPTSKPTTAPVSLPAKNTDVVLSVSTPLYKTASTSGTKLMTIPAGTTITFVAANSQFAGIKCSGVKGYIPLSAMSGAKPVTAPTTAAPTTAPTAAPTSVPTPVKAGSNAKVTASTVIYKSASTSAAKVATIPAGTVVNVVGFTGSWAGIKTGTYKGYVLTSSLTGTTESAPAVIPAGATAVTVNVCWLYSSASTSAAKSQLEKAVTMKVLATSGQWAAVQGTGFKGYVLLSSIRAK